MKQANSHSDMNEILEQYQNEKQPIPFCNCSVCKNKRLAEYERIKNLKKK
jgi:hypothetical protein